MKDKVYEVCREFIKNEETEAVLIVGSSKNLDFSLDIKEIDIFIFTNTNKSQIRETKIIDNLTFDISYFSSKNIKENIKNKEYFFLKEMINPNIVYDKHNIVKNLINICKNLIEEGPNKLKQDEKELLKNNIYAKICDLKNNLKDYERLFLGNIILKEILILNLKINKKWIPKDKKLLNEFDKEIIEVIAKINANNIYDILIKLYEKLV